MTQQSFLGLPPYSGENINSYLLRVRTVVNGLLLGQSNNLGSFSLTINSNTTLISVPDGFLTTTSMINFMPLTSNAALELALGTMYVSNIDATNSQFTITNANNAQADRTFRYEIVG